MLILHHLNNSRSHRIIWLLEELGLPYKLVKYERDSKTMLAPPELKKVWPLGVAPVLQDGDLTIGESAVIIDYILDKYGEGRLRPKPGTPERLQYNYWLQFAESSMLPLTLAQLLFQTVAKRSPFFIRPITKKIKEQVDKAFLKPHLKDQLDFIESTLAKHKWFSGEEFTGADIQMAQSFIMTGVYLMKDKDRPYLKAYIERVKAMPSFIRTLEIGGPLTPKPME